MSQHPSDLFKTSCGLTAPLELNVSGPNGASGERRAFEQPFVLVGRHELASLRLEDAAVSRRHAYLQQLGGRVFCVDLGSRNGVRWGGQSRPAGWLHPDQGIQIGPFGLELAMAAPNVSGLGDEAAEEWDPLQDRVNDSGPLPWIIVEGDEKVQARLRMNRALVLVGSSPACRIRLRQAGISRYHCSLVRTPEGIWMIDLLNEAGTCLNGQPVRWALLKEGDQLQVGPYVLRLEYQNVSTATTPDRPWDIGTETLVQSADDTPESGGRPSQDQRVGDPDQILSSHPSPSPGLPPEPGGLPVPTGNVLVQSLAVPRAEQFATEESPLVAALRAELNQVRECLREGEVFRQQLADSQAECVRLCDQVRTLEMQLAEVNGLQSRLETAEASARELEVVCAERDQWQAEMQALRKKLASEAAEREQGQHQLEAAQQQLVEEREAVRAMGARLDQESATLQEVREVLASRNAEHSAALQQLQEIQDALALSQNETCGLQVELDEARRRLRDAEALRQQLADTQAKHDQLCARVPEVEERANSADRLRDQLWAADTETEQLRGQLRAAESRLTDLEATQAECVRLREEASTLEIQLAEAGDLKARLEAAEASARKLEVVCTERDNWQGEMQTLRNRLATEVAEREQWQHRLETAQQQVVEERETVRAVEVRLDQESAALQGVREDLAARNAEHSAALQRLQVTQEELARSQDEARGLQVELEEGRDRLREAELFRQQLTDRQAECVRLNDQIRTFEIQLAEAANLQSRLETAQASAGELVVVCAERDQWRDEAQALQARLASEVAEREQGQHQLEAAQQQLVEEREAVRAVEARLDQESAALQGVREDLAARNAEHSAALQWLQETQDAFAGLQDEVRDLQLELEQGRERLREAELFGQQLADSQAECVRFCDQVRTLEVQLAEATDLQSRLQAAEARAQEIEAVCAERDQWQAEAQTLRNRFASDSAEPRQIDCLAADLHAAREERDRLHAEHQAALHLAGRRQARVGDLERALTEATAVRERAVAEARACWERERQALEARLEQDRQAHHGATQAALREVQMRAEAAIRELQARAAAEREEWRQRLEGAEAQIVWERGLFQEQGDQGRRQVAALKTERDRLVARLAQAEQLVRAAEERSRNETARVVEPEHVPQLTVRDQLFAQLSGIQPGRLLGQTVRAQAPVGEQSRLTTFEQGSEVAWAGVGVGRERPTTIPNPPGPVNNQVCGTCADAGEKKTVEHESTLCASPAVPPETGEVPNSSDLPQVASAPAESTDPIEDLPSSLPQPNDQPNQRGWRRILSYVLGK